MVEPYQRLSEYIRRLPRGLDSYPECKTKASVFLTALQQKPIPPSADEGLPPSVVSLVRDPVLMSSWVDTPKAMSVLLAIADHHRMSDGDYFDFIRQMNKALFSNRIYRAIMSLASPTFLLRNVATRFSGFHKGATLALESIEPNSAMLDMRYPSFLFDSLLARGFTVSIEVALTQSNARNAQVRAIEENARHLRMRATWS